MKIHRSVPPPTVMPVLVYPDVRAAVDFLTATFGFVQRIRIGEDHRAQAAVGTDGAAIIADVGGDRSPPRQGGMTHLVCGYGCLMSTPPSLAPVITAPWC